MTHANSCFLLGCANVDAVLDLSSSPNNGDLGQTHLVQHYALLEKHAVCEPHKYYEPVYNATVLSCTIQLSITFRLRSLPLVSGCWTDGRLST